jgi:hypothetical protein
VAISFKGRSFKEISSKNVLTQNISGKKYATELGTVENAIDVATTGICGD